MNENVFRYGESERGFGMMTLPKEINGAPIVVLLNAGLTHREGPYRLNVLLARTMAEVGYIAVRVDLSGKGDTPAREGLNNRESVAKDWEFIRKKLVSRFPGSRLVLMGLCSGADNAIKIAAMEPHIHGLILLDPICPRDKDFRHREIRTKLSNPYYWLRVPFWLFRIAKGLINSGGDDENELLNLRDKPTDLDTATCFNNLVDLNGRVLAVFASSAMDYYNMQGQMVISLPTKGLDACCEEEYWPWVTHTYKAQLQRDMLVRRIRQWAETHYSDFRRPV